MGTNSLMLWFLKRRMHKINFWKENPIVVQEKLLHNLLSDAKDTEWGKAYNYKGINSSEEYRKIVPISTYESLKPFIEKIQDGKQQVLWPSPIHYFAKSSGTTSERSKYIPISEQALHQCHFRGGIDMLNLYCNNFPQTKLFSGKNFALCGSQQEHDTDKQRYYADLSAILVNQLPCWAQKQRTPNRNIALMQDWEIKLDKIVEEITKKRITSLAGVPSWIALILEKCLEHTSKSSIKEIWPELEVYFHGGVNFLPYKQHFNHLIGGDIHYMNTYNASEGFFAIQDQKDSDDMLLLLQNGVYYEFVPMEELDKENPTAIPLSAVEKAKNYAILISTNAGLWRYQIGDIVQFTDTAPFRIQITGRTTSFINICGEEVIVDNTTKALQMACNEMNVQVTEYAAAPYFFDENNKIAHQWIIEFHQTPDSLSLFANLLDECLRKVNSDYDAKRYKDLVLQPLLITVAPAGTFYEWMKRKKRLGGQNKVPRLSNERKQLEELLSLIREIKITN